MASSSQDPSPIISSGPLPAYLPLRRSLLPPVASVENTTPNTSEIQYGAPVSTMPGHNEGPQPPSAPSAPCRYSAKLPTRCSEINLHIEGATAADEECTKFKAQLQEARALLARALGSKRKLVLGRMTRSQRLGVYAGLKAAERQLARCREQVRLVRESYQTLGERGKWDDSGVDPKMRGACLEGLGGLGGVLAECEEGWKLAWAEWGDVGVNEAE